VDGLEGDVVIDLNTDALTTDNINRNFYNKGTCGKTSRHFKEANIYALSPKGMGIITEAAGVFYDNRKGGGLIDGIIEYARRKYRTDENFKQEFRKNWHSLGYEISKAAMQRITGYVPAINFDRCNRILSDMFGLRWRFTFCHNDIFRMLDIDGLNNDFIMYDTLVQRIEDMGMLDSRLVRLRSAIDAEVRHFPVLEDFQGLLEEYVAQVNSHLDKRHRIDVRELAADSPAVGDLVSILSSQQAARLWRPAGRFQLHG
jgi:hypothetical protein